MNGMRILEGLIEIALSLVTGFAVFFFSLKIFMLLTRDLDEQKELKKKNTAVAVVLFAFILALVCVVNKSVEPAMDTLTRIFTSENPSVSEIVFNIFRIIVIYVVSGGVALLLLWFGISVYTGFTSRIDEMAELRKNNTAVGILFGVFIFSAGFICMEPLATLLKAFVPQPMPGNIALPDRFVSNPDALVQGFIELPLAFLGTIFISLLGVRLSDRMTGTINETAELKKNNTASAIYTASSLWSLMYLVKEAALGPLYQSLDILITYDPGAGRVVFGLPGTDPATAAVQTVTVIILIPVYFAGTGLIALLITRFAQAVFMFLTKGIDEMAEVKKNNPAVALILAAVTISITVFVSHGVSIVARGLLPSLQAPAAGGLTLPLLPKLR